MRLFGSKLSVTAQIAQAYSLPIDHGAYIQQVIANTPAQSAGLQQGDIIYKVDGTNVNSSPDLGNYLTSKAPGDQVTVFVNRAGSNVQVKATLATLPSGA